MSSRTADAVRSPAGDLRGGFVGLRSREGELASFRKLQRTILAAIALGIVLALASAEMLASSAVADLDEIESFTRSGHGLNTVPSSTAGFAGFHVHVVNSGFYARWTSLLGADITTRLIRVGPEMKLGVFTALLGTPLFFWLVVRLRKTSP